MFKIVSLKLQNNGVYKNNNISDRFFFMMIFIVQGEYLF